MKTRAETIKIVTNNTALRGEALEAFIDLIDALNDEHGLENGRVGEARAKCERILASVETLARPLAKMYPLGEALADGMSVADINRQRGLR